MGHWTEQAGRQGGREGGRDTLVWCWGERREILCDFSHLEYKGLFILWPSKSRGCGIEWPNFGESSRKWAINRPRKIGIGAFGWP